MVVVGVVVTTLDKVGSDSELMESSIISREIGFKVQIFSDLTVVAVGFGVVAGPGEDRSDQNRKKKFLIRAGAG